jgi:hypothetical protein
MIFQTPNTKLFKVTIVQDIIVGVNTIVHNLNLIDPKGFSITIIDDTDNLIIISNFQNFTNNSFEFISAISRTNCTFTIL